MSPRRHQNAGRKRRKRKARKKKAAPTREHDRRPVRRETRE